MAITIKAPDGSSIQFPDGTPEATITDVMRKNFGGPNNPAPPKGEQPSAIDRIVASPIGRFTQENIVDPAMGAIHLIDRYIGGIDDPRMDAPAQAEQKWYQDALARNRNTPGYQEAAARLEQASGNEPSASSGAFLPSLQSTIAGLPALLSGDVDMSNAMADRAAAKQTQYSKDNPALSVAQSFAGGMTLAPEGGLPKVVRPAIPTAEDIKKTARTAYEAARNSGLEIATQPVTDMVQAVKTELIDQGFDPVLHPNAARSLQRLEQIGTDPNLATVSLKQLDTERKVAGQASKSAITNPADSHMAGIIQDHIDNLVENLSPDQIVSGDPAAVQQISAARQAWRTAKKSDLLGTAFEKAANQAGGYTQSGFGNALRTQFKQIADNPKKFNSFSKTEQGAILKVVRGGRVQDALRWIGKLAPRGVVSLMSDLGLGAATGGGAVPFMLAGEGARAASTAMKLRDAENAFKLVRSGGDASALAPQLIPAPAPAKVPIPIGLLGPALEQQQKQQYPYGLVFQ